MWALITPIVAINNISCRENNYFILITLMALLPVSVEIFSNLTGVPFCSEAMSECRNADEFTGISSPSSSTMKPSVNLGCQFLICP